MRGPRRAISILLSFSLIVLSPGYDSYRAAAQMAAAGVSGEAAGIPGFAAAGARRGANPSAFASGPKTLLGSPSSPLFPATSLGGVTGPALSAVGAVSAEQAQVTAIQALAAPQGIGNAVSAQADRTPADALRRFEEVARDPSKAEDSHDAFLQGLSARLPASLTQASPAAMKAVAARAFEPSVRMPAGSDGPDADGPATYQRGVLSEGASPEENLAAIQEDIARRTRLAKPMPAGERIAVVALGRMAQGAFPKSVFSRMSAKEMGTYTLRATLNSVGLTNGKLEALVARGMRLLNLGGAVDTSGAPNIGRELVTSGGFPMEIPGTGICKNCGTSLEAVSIALSLLRDHHEDFVTAGGEESMSRQAMHTDDKILKDKLHAVLYLDTAAKEAKSWLDFAALSKAFATFNFAPFITGSRLIVKPMRWWARRSLKKQLSQTKLRYAIGEGLAIDGIGMGQTAETLQRIFGIQRGEVDDYAFESQRRAAEAAKKGEFAKEMVPVPGKDGRPVNVDQGIRFENSRSGYNKLKPVLDTENVTAGNASQISDGASTLVLMRESEAEALGLIPLAFVTAARAVGVDPRVMGLGPAYAVPQAVQEAGLTMDKIQVFEINEAFAAQVLAVLKALGLEHDERVNPLGGAVAIGHPLAATGTRLAATLISYMLRHGLIAGVAGACIGGGEGIAAVFQRDPNLIPTSFKEAVRKGLEARGVSKPVQDLVEETLNGLPPIFRQSKSGGLETYRSVWNFVGSLNELASNGGSSVNSFSADSEALFYQHGLAFIDKYFDPASLAALDRDIQSRFPGFRAAYEAEYGPGTYDVRGALAHFAALEVYNWSDLGHTAPIPQAETELFAPVHEAFAKASTDKSGASTGRELYDKLMEVGKSLANITNRYEESYYGDNLRSVLKAVEQDIALFGQRKDEASEFQYFKYVIDERGIATVAISRAPINALNFDVGEEAKRLFEKLKGDSRVKVVVFTGEGDVFIGGADLNVIQDIKTKEEGQAASAGLQAILNELEDFPKYVIMALNGKAVGGGAELAMTGDWIVASPDAQMWLPEIGLGLNPGAGGTQRAVRRMGVTDGITAMTDGKPREARTALALGWIDEVADSPAQVLSAAYAKAGEYLAMDETAQAKVLAEGRALDWPIRLTPMERLGIYVGKGTALGALLGLGAGLWLFGFPASLAALMGFTFAGMKIGKFLPGKLWAKVGMALGAGLALWFFGFPMGALIALLQAAALAGSALAGFLVAERFFGRASVGAFAGLGAYVWLAGWPVVLLQGLAVVGLILAGAALMSWLLPGNGWLIKNMAAKQTKAAEKSEYIPNVLKIIEAAITGVQKGPEAGLKAEAGIFGQLSVRPLAKLMTALVLRITGGPKLAGVTDNPDIQPIAIDKVGVAGIGKMGSGIAQLFANADVPVVVKDETPEYLEVGLGRIRALFSNMVRKFILSPRNMAKKMSRIQDTVDIAGLAAAKPGLIIEAIPEVEAWKVDLFRKLGAETDPETILATNTSALSVTKLALASGRPGKVIGLHFFNPVHKVPLVELVLPDRDKLTEEQNRELDRTIVSVLPILKKTGRIVVFSKDRPGFIVNRMLVPYINEAARLLEEGATIEQVDNVIRKLGWPMGPLELADYVGLGLGVEVGSYLEKELPHLGRMSGLMAVLLRWGYSGNPDRKVADKGFYNYREVPDRKTKEPKVIRGKPNDAVVRRAAALLRALARTEDAARALLMADAKTDPETLAWAVEGLDQELGGWSTRVSVFVQQSLAQRREAEGLWRQARTSTGRTRAEAMEKFLNKIRGEYGVLGWLAKAQEDVEKSLGNAKPRKISDKEIEERLLYAMENEGERILGERVAQSVSDLDIALKAGTDAPSRIGGPIRYVSGQGLRYVTERKRHYAQNGGGSVFEPAEYGLRLVEQGRGLYGEEQ